MTSPVLAIIEAQNAPTAQTTLYTSALVTTRIDKLSATNTTNATIILSINLVPSGQSAGTTNLTTNAQAILAGQTWNSPNEYGQCLNPGDFLSAIASATGLTIMASGTVLT